MSEEHDKNRASRMLDDLMSEGLEQTAPVAAAGPILPRVRMVVTGAAAPVTVTRRKNAGETMRPASEMLPEILKEVDEARRKDKESRRAMTTAPEPEKISSIAAPSPVVPRGMSRLRRRFALTYGKQPGTLFRPRHAETVETDAVEDKAIYQAKMEGIPVRKSGWWEHSHVSPWIFLAPALAVFLFFAWLPMARGLLLSFEKVSLVGSSSFIGVDNYARAFSDPLFWATFWHALLFCLLSLGLGFWLPVMLAIIMNELKRGQGWLRFAFFLPFLTPTVPAVILWRWILDQGYGVLNSLIALLGFSQPHIPWLNQPLLAMISVVVVFLWKNTGWNALIYIAALREVPEELYEAAELEGATVRTRVRQVSLPALRNTMGVLLIMQVINSFQIFTEVYLLTQGGPMASTEVIATYLYKKSFLYLDIGYASALAVVLFLVLLSFTSLRMKTIEQEA